MIEAKIFNHVKCVFSEKFDCDIDESDYIKLCEKANDPLKHCRSYNHSDNRDFRLVRFKGKIVTVVYNENQGLVQTVVYPRPKDKQRYRESEKMWKSLNKYGLYRIY